MAGGGGGQRRRWLDVEEVKFSGWKKNRIQEVSWKQVWFCDFLIIKPVVEQLAVFGSKTFNGSLFFLFFLRIGSTAASAPVFSSLAWSHLKVSPVQISSEIKRLPGVNWMGCGGCRRRGGVLQLNRTHTRISTSLQEYQYCRSVT